jgi:hypothetical protein
MKPDEFADVVASMAFRPGYEVEAKPGLGVVKITVTAKVQDSDRQYAPLGYPVTKQLPRVEWHDVSRLEDANDVYMTVLNVLTRYDRHEHREFTRLPGEEWRAPLHPHTDDGKLTYIRELDDKSIPLERVDF